MASRGYRLGSNNISEVAKILKVAIDARLINVLVMALSLSISARVCGNARARHRVSILGSCVLVLARNIR
jgi:uncharacterized membrane protein